MTVSSQGITRGGTLNGNTVPFSTNYPEDGRTTSVTGTLTIDGRNLTGESTWSWSNGNSSCSGTSTISGTKV